MELQLDRSFGVIVGFSMSDFDLPKEVVMNAFHEAGLKEQFCPNERMPRKAFQKALKESIEGEEGFMIRPVVKSGSTMSSGLVEERKFGDIKDLIYNVHNVLTLNSELEIIQGKSDFRTEAIVESYKEYRNQLGAVEVGQKLKEIFFVSMGIDILCDKCIFVPSKYKVNVDKVENLFKLLVAAGAKGIQIQIIAVDTGTQTRNTIVEQFSRQTIALLEKEIAFALEQRQRFETGAVKYLRKTAFQKQLGKLHTLEERIKTYVVLLNLTSDEDKPILDKLEQADIEITKNIELASSLSGKSTKVVSLAQIPK